MIHVAGYLLLYASACVNPIIYVIMNAQYRAAYAAALCCPLSRLSGLTSGAYPSSPVACQTKKTERTSAQASYIRPWRYHHLIVYTSIRTGTLVSELPSCWVFLTPGCVCYDVFMLVFYFISTVYVISCTHQYFSRQASGLFSFTFHNAYISTHLILSHAYTNEYIVNNSRYFEISTTTNN